MKAGAGRGGRRGRPRVVESGGPPGPRHSPAEREHLFRVRGLAVLWTDHECRLAVAALLDLLARRAGR